MLQVYCFNKKCKNIINLNDSDIKKLDVFNKSINGLSFMENGERIICKDCFEDFITDLETHQNGNEAIVAVCSNTRKNLDLDCDKI